MSSNNKNFTTIAISAVVALGIGVAIGSSLGGKGLFSAGDKNNNATPELADLPSKSVEELSAKLSEVMLPENEFSKLESAISQAGVGLLMAQSQAAGLTASEDMQNELKKNLAEKYNRKYFSDLNSESMKDLTKEELIAIINFYHTEAGKKFLEKSPQIIQATMAKVQADIGSNLPTMVTSLVEKHKNGGADKADKKEEAAPADKKDGANG